MSCWFLFANEELTRKGTPLRLRVAAAASVASNAPACFRKSSCTDAVEPSRDSETIRIPLSFILSHTASVTSVPFVAMHIRNPLSVPYFAISKRSGRRSGSPPERTRTGLQKEVMSSMSAFASASEKSVSWDVIDEAARQWMQFRLQRPVTSQAIHFGMNSSLAKVYPLFAARRKGLASNRAISPL